MLCIRSGCWLSSWTSLPAVAVLWWLLALFLDIISHLPACSALAVVVGFLHGHLSQEALHCGGCLLSSWDHISQHALHWQWLLAFFMDISPRRLCTGEVPFRQILFFFRQKTVSSKTVSSKNRFVRNDQKSRTAPRSTKNGPRNPKRPSGYQKVSMFSTRKCLNDVETRNKIKYDRMHSKQQQHKQQHPATSATTTTAT